MIVPVHRWVAAPLLALLVATGAAAADIREERLSFTTHDGLEIRCILALPAAAAGKHPGMLLLPGSGLHDADVTVEVPTLAVTRGRQALFRPLARQFSRQGWAVLRCNKRGASFGHANDRPAVLQRATLDDLVRDAGAALATLYSHPQVAASPLVVLGHSEGAGIAARLAQQMPQIDLVVMVGSVARSFAELMEYQLVDRNLQFFRRAADGNGDGLLTLPELDALDGEYGMGSVYVLNSAAVLFDTAGDSQGGRRVTGFRAETDTDGDGRLHLTEELQPALRADARRLLELAREGVLGAYWQSLVESPAPVSEIHRVRSRILFVHGELDVQSPLEEPLALMAALERAGRDDYDMLFLPLLGHSLSRPNDFYGGDGGLTILDNLTLNAPRAKTRRLLLQRIEANLAP